MTARLLKLVGIPKWPWAVLSWDRKRWSLEWAGLRSFLGWSALIGFAVLGVLAFLQTLERILR